MGCFNAACSVSNISIGAGDPIAFIPLEMSRYRYHIGDGNHMFIHPYCFYSPATLPIFGRYNDYGGIEDVERCPNVEVIEKFFKVPIMEVCGNHNKTVKRITSGMFVHREIYNKLVSVFYDEWGGRKGHFVPSCKKALKSFKGYRDSVAKAKAIGKKCSLRKKMWSVYIEDPIVFREYRLFKNIYMSYILRFELEDELAEFYLFDHAMSACNVFYFPAANGYQFGNHRMSRVLYREALRIVNGKIRQRREWEKEYAEEGSSK